MNLRTILEIDSQNRVRMVYWGESGQDDSQFLSAWEISGKKEVYLVGKMYLIVGCAMVEVSIRHPSQKMCDQ